MGVVGDILVVVGWVGVAWLIKGNEVKSNQERKKKGK